MNQTRIKEFVCSLLISFLLFSQSIPAYAEYSFSKDADAIEKVAQSVFMLEVYDINNQKVAVGSGFVAFDSDLLITNHHVIADGSYVIAISDNSERYLLSRTCVVDKQNDIAIMKFDSDPDIMPLEIDPVSPLKRSHTVVAIGSPAGLMNTISICNISAFYTRDNKDWIQFTAPISSGSSGGVLLNDSGKVIGITTATYASAQNVNMAVKAQYLCELYQEWDQTTTTAMNKKAYSIEHVSTETPSKETTDYVWCTANGSKYHSSETCSNMKAPIRIRLLEALESGLNPCGKCYR